MKKTVLTIVGVIALAAGVYMFIKKDNPRLTELRNAWWIPLPIAFVCFAVAGVGNKK